ncbi:LOW QUALITY PROTEIN: Reverse transcriptase [Phytophthora palmivora]|uniref:Reverse transcriptase n=1 Tax=Phytophthora palmivora TaxID=4796 RepID=A0A2P4XKF7_9STRA|nr:LOW QUALITY PROTEIN: Reverse transcriptase [Phytophthora palmivora]
MVYPMPLINALLDDLDEVLWYCSLDMASGFWVVPMTDRARSISAFITPFGLGIGWNRMPFGLKNAPQIYQRLLDNALYGFLKVTQDQDRPDRKDVFETGEPDLERNESVLGRRSYIDDILVTGRSWNALCEKVEKLLDACDEWNLSISVAKSFWGRQKVDYLGHRVSAEVLYELREADFYEIARKIKLTGDDEGVVVEEDDSWTEAKEAFATLKNKIVNAPILQHFDVDGQPVVVVYASKWAISAALMQEHDGVYKPVTFTSRTLKPNEINYGMVDKEVLALLRILDICYTQLVTRSIKVLTRHSTLAWLLHSSGLQGRLGRWAALLSSWTLEIVKCVKGEDEILGVIAASITPRKEVDSILISIAPRKQPGQVISMPPPIVEPDEKLLVVSFDGSARVKQSGRAYSGIVWSLPDWTVISVASRYKLDLTVNEAEYHGLLLCLDLLSDMDRGRLIICGDSNLVIRQMKGEIECKASGALERLRSWPNHEFLHMKRDWNQSAGSLASAALRRESGVGNVTEEERQDLMTLNRLDELLIAKDDAATVKIAAVTRSRKNVDPRCYKKRSRKE